ncbi:grasp-with-spasm system ATP-grasp peptide maturase [Mucilaginibacter sp. UYCu711]|uniref:grasp-with-spasm system ATP-grasp peptide maturase n=1 Tax=Mucilaginibacter sp. UYCu711 TaxID=3156339 RepID=UPI003D23AC61
MILIISKRKLEPSTEAVIDWLNFFNQSILRINGDDIYVGNTLKIEGDSKNGVSALYKLKGEYVNLKDINFSAAWYRRWSDNDHLNRFFPSLMSHEHFQMIHQVVGNDMGDLRTFFIRQLNVKSWLTDPRYANVNKLNVLKLAGEEQISIPDSIICSDLETLRKFKGPRQIITKDLSNPYFFFIDGFRVTSFTTEITDTIIERLPRVFVPSFFQELIEKEYEVRSFYLSGKFYSMAIFSQNDEQTRVDFRNYNGKVPNRTVPYKLEHDLEEKLIRVFEKLNLNSGSVDLIKSKSQGMVFLEINPIGQYGMTSGPCNYNLDKKIAEFLIHGR